jgi:hypothetical protein
MSESIAAGSLKLYVNKKRVFLPMIYFSFVGLLSLYVIILGPNSIGIFWYLLNLVAMAAYVLVVYLGVKKLRSPLPEVELDEKGVRLNQDLSAPWSIFSGYANFVVHGQSGFVLKLKDVEGFSQSLAQHPRRLVLRAVIRGAMKSPFAIETSRLVCNPVEVEACLAKYLVKMPA